MDEPLIRYKNVNINQQELGVLEDVNLELNKGEFVYLIGKVGSGKTSLLKTIYGELDIQSGDAEVLGYNMSNIKRKHIPQLRRRLGIVFQDFQLRPISAVGAVSPILGTSTSFPRCTAACLPGPPCAVTTACSPCSCVAAGRAVRSTISIPTNRSSAVP